MWKIDKDQLFKLYKIERLSCYLRSELQNGVNREYYMSGESKEYKYADFVTPYKDLGTLSHNLLMECEDILFQIVLPNSNIRKSHGYDFIEELLKCWTPEEITYKGFNEFLSEIRRIKKRKQKNNEEGL